MSVGGARIAAPAELPKIAAIEIDELQFRGERRDVDAIRRLGCALDAVKRVGVRFSVGAPGADCGWFGLPQLAFARRLRESVLYSGGSGPARRRV